MISNNLKKIFGILILVCFLSTITFLPYVETRRAEAGLIAVIESGMQLILTGLSRIMQFMMKYKEYILDPAIYYLSRMLIRQLTQSVVDWINGGFNGNPSFLEDPQDYFEKSADRAIGEMIYDSDLRFLCKPFEINVRLSLGLQYSPFQDKVRCRLSDVLANSEGAVTDTYNKFMGGDFIAGGGWDTWLQLTTVPQNNQLGSMLIAKAELDARLEGEEKRKTKELEWGAGMLSQKKCEAISYDGEGNEITRISYSGDEAFSPSDFASSTRGATAGNTRQTGLFPGASTTPSNYNVYSNYTFRNTENADGTGEVLSTIKQECKIITPGSWMQDTLQRHTNSDLAQLQIADEINEIVGALANFLVTKITQESGLLGQNDRDRAADDASWRQGLANLSAQQNILLSQGVQASTATNESGINSTLNSVYNADITPGYNGTGSVNDVAIDANGNSITLSQAKQILTTRISGYQQIESNYYSYNSTMYNVASTTVNKINSVIACYNQKIASSTPALSSSQTSFAQTRISQLSGALADTNSVVASTTPNVTSALSNLSSLNTLSSSASNAGNVNTLNTISASLDSLVPSLHNASTTEIARQVSSTTVSWLGPVLNNANALATECQTFPAGI